MIIICVWVAVSQSKLQKTHSTVSSVLNIVYIRVIILSKCTPGLDAHVLTVDNVRVIVDRISVQRGLRLHIRKSSIV